jgi:hypothetical protein
VQGVVVPEPPDRRADPDDAARREVRPLRGGDRDPLDQPAGHRRHEQAGARGQRLRRERHRDDRHRGVRDAGQRLDRVGRDLGEQPCGGPGRGGQQHGVRGEHLPAGQLHVEAGAGPPQPLRAGAQPHLRAAGPHQDVGQRADARGDGHEHRAVGVPPAARAVVPRGGGRRQHRGGAAQLREEPGHRRGQ